MLRFVVIHSNSRSNTLLVSSFNYTDNSSTSIVGAGSYHARTEVQTLRLVYVSVFSPRRPSGFACCVECCLLSEEPYCSYNCYTRRIRWVRKCIQRDINDVPEILSLLFSAWPLFPFGYFRIALHFFFFFAISQPIAILLPY